MTQAQTKRDGVLFAATGRQYIEAAIRAAESVRQACPGLGIVFYGDWQAQGFNFSPDPAPFDAAYNVENPHRRSKVDVLAKTPFERTLYLDTDTRVVEDITPMFDILDRFDIAVAHAMRRNSPERMITWRKAIPKAFPQFNSGVILYRATPQVLGFLQEWSEHFANAGFAQDQMTFRELLWLSDLRMAVLPPEYNVRYEKYIRLWSKEEATPKILHMEKFHTGEAWMWIKPVYRRLVKGLARVGIHLPRRLVKK